MRLTTFPLEADRWAQLQTAMYEQFLQALTGIVLGVRNSGEDVTPYTVKKATRKFNYYYWNLRELLEENTPAEYRRKDNECYSDAYMELEQFQIKLAQANLGTFKSAVVFGETQAFHTIEAHGALGLLAQQRAQTIEWNVRGKDGRTLNAIKAFYVNCRDFYYQRSLDLALETVKPERQLYIVDKNFEKVRAVKAEELKPDSEIRKAYFHVGSYNWLSYE